VEASDGLAAVLGPAVAEAASLAQAAAKVDGLMVCSAAAPAAELAAADAALASQVAPALVGSADATDEAASALERRPRLKDALKQLKECLDEGLLSQEEFDAEKKLLLQAIREAARAHVHTPCLPRGAPP